jgi:hypothetical protein
VIPREGLEICGGNELGVEVVRASAPVGELRFGEKGRCIQNVCVDAEGRCQCALEKWDFCIGSLVSQDSDPCDGKV